MGNQEPCRLSLFLQPFLFIFSFPIQLFLFSQFNHPFLPFSTILSFPFQPSFPFLAFTIHPSFPSFFISSIIFYLLYPFLNYFISISSFFNFFIQHLIFLLLFYLSVGNQRLGSVSISRYLQHQDSSSSIFKDLEQDEVQDFQEIRINHRVPEIENQLIQPDKTER